VKPRCSAACLTKAIAAIAWTAGIRPVLDEMWAAFCDFYNRLQEAERAWNDLAANAHDRSS
jgi:hypothetical protein